MLAIGLQGNLRKLGVPGEDLDVRAVPARRSRTPTKDETIVVVGAGDAAIENAVALAKQNRVIMINRSAGVRALQGGQPRSSMLAAIKDGKLECRYQASADQRRATPGGANAPACSTSRRRPASSRSSATA